MAGIVGIGYQNFEHLRKNDIFYIDKTMFIKEWWENCDIVTLITRPRRFGNSYDSSEAVGVSFPLLWKKRSVGKEDLSLADR